VLKLSACRQSTDAWAPMHTGKLPKACECYRQLWALSEVRRRALPCSARRKPCPTVSDACPESRFPACSRPVLNGIVCKLTGD
jgi:hypothetical protein